MLQISRKTEGRGLAKALTLSPDQIIDMVEKDGLTGRGGAHFPTGRKWRFTRAETEEPKIVICNADEGEPGTFKDRFIIRNHPETLIEGIIITCYAIGAERAYIYLRAEYENLLSNLHSAIERFSDELDNLGIQLDIFMGQGAYICGDETAIMNSIEGLRGEPRAKPPYPAKRGVFDKPTCINNVSTLTQVPLLVLEPETWENRKLYSLSGNVSKPGVYEYVSGVKAGELISRGQPEKPIKALFFGCAGGCVPYDPELPLSVEALGNKGAMLGSFAVIAVDEEQSIPAICKNITDFFVHESCGRCTPCREGNYQVLQILKRLLKREGSFSDLAALEDLAEYTQECAFCGLGQTSMNHITTSLRFFRKEFEDLCTSKSTTMVT